MGEEGEAIFVCLRNHVKQVSLKEGNDRLDELSTLPANLHLLVLFLTSDIRPMIIHTYLKREAVNSAS